MLSLYIHIPYCAGKCQYCGFYSTPYEPRSADDFVSALQREAELRYKNFGDKRFGALYIGGGTPTVLSREQLGRLFGIVGKYFRFEENGEITIEANPNTVTEGGLSFLLELGVNRLSLGIQSFSDTALRTLGRAHSAGQAVDAFRRARSAGFKNIGIDLIFGIPAQTGEEWRETVDAAIALKPDHISAYGLSIDHGSQFMARAKAGKLALLPDEIVAEMYEHAVRKLSSAGYLRYEISNFSLPGFECRHNRNYWERGEYLGLGPGASSFLAGKRQDNIADTAEYTRRLSQGLPATEAEEVVGADSAARETILLGLRTGQGVDLHRFQRVYGTALLKRLKENIGALETAGLLLHTDGHIRLTERGFLLADEALTRLSV
jgi:oxygen-independent coproporphyrinogen-3 oxidase